MIFFQALLEIDIDRHIQIKITHPKVQVLKPFFD